MQNVRIIELPCIPAAFSGPLRTAEAFSAFVQWFSSYHAARKNELYPRDFMWYNEREDAREWFYALPADASAADCGGFEIRTLPGGLFAVASCLDADLDQAADWMQTRQQLLDWAAASDRFEAWVNAPGVPERYPLFHIVSPGRLIETGISIEDFYLPIREK